MKKKIQQRLLRQRRIFFKFDSGLLNVIKLRLAKGRMELYYMVLRSTTLEPSNHLRRDEYSVNLTII